MKLSCLRFQRVSNFFQGRGSRNAFFSIKPIELVIFQGGGGSDMRRYAMRMLLHESCVCTQDSLLVDDAHSII